MAHKHMIPVNKRKITMELEYQPYIEAPPVTNQSMWQASTASDKITIESWRTIWLNNIKANKEYLGSFSDYSMGNLFRKHVYKPAILVGSGPSLKYNGQLLKVNKGVPVISCLHNFHYFIDNEIPVDYFVSLDAGEVVLEEISEGGKLTSEEYWEKTKDYTLIAFTGSHPDLLKNWKGKLYVFGSPVPDKEYEKQSLEIEEFHTYISSGGNVLGACMYIAKAVLGCPMVAFLGADFAFSYDDKFHGWDSKYDKDLGAYIKVPDIYGNKIKTWRSYYNFATWFNYIAQNIPGIYINCTEGGVFGAYEQGNIMKVIQMPFAQFLNMLNMHKEMEDQFKDPTINQKLLLF